VSGSGNVAIYAVEKLQQLGATVVACSDSSGFVHDPAGLDLACCSRSRRSSARDLHVYAERRPSARFVPKGNVWEVPCHVAVPSATQNELSGRDA
jgi:glutamate dehydrogenase (NADP+)